MRLELLGTGRLSAAAVVVGAAEVRPGRGLDAVGAVAEVDRVEVLGEDLLLRPLARHVVGQRRLFELVEQRALLLGLERLLDELLGDRRAALHGAAGDDVLPQGARDAAQVDARVRVEAAVLDRDDRVADVRADVAVLDEETALVGRERRQLAPLASESTEFWDFATVAVASSAGRSEATAIIIPKTVETPARATSGIATRSRRNFLTRGLTRGGATGSGMTSRSLNDGARSARADRRSGRGGRHPRKGVTLPSASRWTPLLAPSPQNAHVSLPGAVSRASSTRAANCG